MSDSKIKISLIGECMVEFSGASFNNMKQGFGGDSLNTAIYLSRLNTNDQYQVHYITAMGDDTLSSHIVDEWKKEGVNTDNVLTDSTRSPGAYLIQLDSKGERSFVYWRDNSAAKHIVSHANFYRVERLLQEMDFIYLSGISLAILPERDCQQLIALLTQLAADGKRIIFDTNHRPRLWVNKGGEKQAQHIYTQLLAISDIALLTDDDEIKLWGDKDYLSVINRLAQSGVKKMVLKRGEHGCIYHDFNTGESITTRIEKHVQVVDTTSAGDSFNAGYLNGYLRDLTPEICAEIGNLIAGIVIQHKGALIDKSLLDNAITRANNYE